MEFIQPRTVIAWQKKRFRDYWRRLSQSGKPGRPAISKEVIDLIRDMWRSNPTWGSPRIVGELHKIGLAAFLVAVTADDPLEAIFLVTVVMPWAFLIFNGRLLGTRVAPACGHRRSTTDGIAGSAFPVRSRGKRRPYAAEPAWRPS